MTSADVIGFYTKLNRMGIKIWIDGGWGVDALLGKQTRPHGDLDIAVEKKYVAQIRELLEAQGYKDVIKDDTSEWNFVLGDDHGRQIDVHAFVFDDQGNVKEGIKYPAGSLSGTGVIDGHAVNCISPEHMVKFHTGYKLRESDLHDVAALCERFGIEYPEEYVHLKKPRRPTKNIS